MNYNAYFLLVCLFFSQPLFCQQLNDPYEGMGYKPFMRWQLAQEMKQTVKGENINAETLIYQSFQKFKKKQKQSPQRNYSGAWVEEGPFAYQNGELADGAGMGRINCLAFHPNNANIIFAGAPAGGLWKTTNGGNTWHPLTDGIPSIGISGIAIDPNNTNKIWILTGDGDGKSTYSIGVLYSSDGGVSWHKRTPDFVLDDIVRPYKLLMHPNNPLIQFLASDDGLYKTTDGWMTSNRVLNTKVFDVEQKPNSPNTLYSATSNGLYISTDLGDNWVFNDDNGVLLSPANFTRFAIGITPENPAAVYIFYGGGNTGFPGFYKSMDSGNNWTLKSNTPNICDRSIPFNTTEHQASYDLALAIDPDNENIIYTGGINIFKSLNGGSAFSLNSYQSPSNVNFPYVHADIHALEFNNGSLYVGCDGGVFKSTDGGATYTDLSAGLRISQYHYIDAAATLIMGGLQDNGTNLFNADNGTNAVQIRGNDGFACMFNPDDPSEYYASTQDHRYRFDDQGWTNISADLNIPPSWNEDFQMTPNNTNGLMMARNEVYRSFNRGDSWEDMDAFDNNENSSVTAMVMSPSPNDYRIYVAKGDLLKRCDGYIGGIQTISWTNLSNEIPDSFYITDMALDYADDRRLFISLGGFDANNKVWRKNGINGPWVNLTGSLPNVPIYCIEYQQGTNDRVYVGTEIGVFFRDNDLGDWQYFGNYLPVVPVRDLKIKDDPQGSKLFAGTYGRGIWSSPIVSSICLANYSLTENNYPGNSESDGIQIFQATNSITSSRKIDGGFGTYVLYSADNFVELTTGFEAKQNNIFTVNLEGCTGITLPSINNQDIQTN